MRLSVDAKNAMLDALDEGASLGAKFASLHTGYSSSGTLELPLTPYARVGVTWAVAAAGAKQTSGPFVFNVGAGAQVRFIGFWTASTGGTFLGMSPNGGGMIQDFVVAEFATDLVQCVGHGFAVGDSVVVWGVPGDPLPTGLTEGGVYFVIAAGFTTEVVTLSPASGGAAVNITSTGAGYLQKIVSETFGGPGTHTVTQVTMTMD